MTIEKNTTVKRWLKKLEVRNRSVDFELSSTKRGALYWLQIFCNFCKLTPNKLIADREETAKSPRKVVQRKHEEMVDDFIIYLRNQGKSSNTISTAVGLIRSFYKWNYEELKEVTPINIQKVRHFKMPSVEDIKKICKIADLPTKTWILCQKDSGLANIDLLLLTRHTESSEFGTIKTQLKKGVVPLHVEVRRQKTGEPTHTFFGPNAIDALNQHVNFRSRDPHLFRMSVRTIQKNIKRYAIQAKVTTEHAPVTPYTLRKFFNTTMKYTAMVPESVVEGMMGHSTGRVVSAYGVVGKGTVGEGLPISSLAETYMKAYKHIDINQVTKNV